MSDFVRASKPEGRAGRTAQSKIAQVVGHVENLCLREKLGREHSPAVRTAGPDECEEDAAAGRSSALVLSEIHESLLVRKDVLQERKWTSG